MYQVSEDIRQFLTPVREFILHNATDEPVLIMYSGETRVIPAIDQIIYPHPKFSDVCFSAKDLDGDWIPGTLVFRDMVQMYMNNQEGEVWSAANAIKHALDIDIKSGVASGKYAERGISLLPPTPTKDLLEKVVADGRKRYMAWRLRWAKEVAEGYEGRISALKAAGHSPIPLGADYDRARAIIDAGREVDKQKMLGRPGYEPNTPIPSPQASQQEAPISDQELAELIASKIGHLSVPTSTGAPASMDRETLVQNLMADPKAMAILKTKFKVRKLRETKQPLDAA